MPRNPIIVNFDGKDHRILDGEATACGLIAPHGLEWQALVTSDCPTCFPKGEPREAEAEPVFSIATPAEELGRYENPDAEEGEPGYVEPAKPAKKATKAG